jgi:rhodanese-related sulfurtransferase
MKKSFFLTVCIAVLFAFMAAVPASAYEDVTPAQAYDLAAYGSGGAVYYIVDVRTAEEWKWVGHPGKNKAGIGAELEGKVVNVSYKIAHKDLFIVNPSFLTEINELFGAVKENVVLITMCRSGDRSVLAATLLEMNGYRVMNMLTGFEGGTDTFGYRTKNGWAVNGLPYSYSGTGAYPD